MMHKMSGNQTRVDIKFYSYGRGDPIDLVVADEETAEQLGKAVTAIGGVSSSTGRRNAGIERVPREGNTTIM